MGALSADRREEPSTTMPDRASPSPSPAPAASSGVLAHLATYRGLGGVLATVAGPGPAPGSERLYQSYIYIGGTLDLVSIDPETGEHQVFEAPVKGESGAWALVAGPDGRIYLGTLPHAHLLRLDPATGEFVDLGRPSESEQYIWQLANGADGRLYGCTYPSAKLVRYDPAMGRSEDLGRMDPVEQYARHVAASDDGFVYVGIGTSAAHLVAYELATGEHRDVLPEAYRVTGTAIVYRGEDGLVYAQAGGQAFRLDRWQVVPVAAEAARRAPANRLRDGRMVDVAGSTVRVRDPRSGAEQVHPFRYTGKTIDVFRLGLGPDGRLYGSSVLPIHFFRVDPLAGGLEEIGRLGGGEFYSFLQLGSWLLGAAYGGDAPLMRYDPWRPFAPGRDAQSNPVLVTYEGQDSGWRPMAMVAGPDGKVYLGAVAGYGLLGGPLVIWDPATDRVQSFHHVVRDQSVVSLAVAGGLIVGGTTIGGGGGSRPTQREAKLFLWDPATQQKLFECVPVLGAGQITDLITAPNGRVYGIATAAAAADQAILFAFDPPARQVVHTAALPFARAIYNSVAIAPDGRAWGLADRGIFAIDLESGRVQLVAETPERITAGFAFDGQNLYFACGPAIYRYTLPAERGHAA